MSCSYQITTSFGVLVNTQARSSRSESFLDLQEEFDPDEAHVWIQRGSFHPHTFIIPIFERFGCGLPGCKSVFRTKTQAEAHIESHLELSEGKSFVCLRCREEFRAKNEAQRHCRTQNRGNIYACVQCGKEFNRDDNLQRHQKKFCH